MEAGLRRDDLWGRAFARSGGDTQKAHAIYIDLLARRLAEEAGEPPLLEGIEATTAVVTNAGKSFLSFVSKAVVALCICVVVLITLSFVGDVAGKSGDPTAFRFFLAILALAALAFIFLSKKE